MRAFSRYAKRGFTLVELMIVVAIIGVLAALAIFGVSRYLKSAKTSEAKNSIGRISRGAQEAYERETNKAEVIPLGGSSAVASNALCVGAAKNVPDGTAPPAGKKYVPNNDVGIDYNSGSASDGWKCLRFEINDPQYFMYNYSAVNVGGFPGNAAGGPAVDLTNGYEANALGDLDGDTLTSTFSLSGQIEAATKTLNRSTQVYISEEFE